ncbi:MAG: DMT family transporter [Bdellovibrionales bacterium]
MSQSAPQQAHDYRKGVTLFLLFMVCDSAVAVLTRMNMLHMSLGCYNFWRSAAAMAYILIIMSSRGQLRDLVPPNPRGLIVNALLGGISTGLFTYVYSQLPTADVFAIINLSPFFVALLSIVLLGDRIARPHYAAIVVGFLGAMVIVQPGSSLFSADGLAAIFTTFLYALTIVLSSWLAGGHSTNTIVAYNMGVMVVATAPFALDITPEFGVQDMWLMALTCGLYVVYRIAIVASLRYAPSAYLAPLEYFSIVLVAIMAYMLYGEVPTYTLWTGAVIIIAAGLYIMRTPQHVIHKATPGLLK